MAELQQFLCILLVAVARSPVTALRCDEFLRTSGFTDDVMFSYHETPMVERMGTKLCSLPAPVDVAAG